MNKQTTNKPKVHFQGTIQAKASAVIGYYLVRYPTGALAIYRSRAECEKACKEFFSRFHVDSDSINIGKIEWEERK